MNGGQLLTGAGTLPRRVVFELDRPTALLNTVLRMHWRERSAHMRALAWDIRIALGGRLPSPPFSRARVIIERHSLGTPDHDGLVGGAKLLIDCLCRPGPPVRVARGVRCRHPMGLSVIEDDGPAYIELQVRAVRVGRAADQKTIVQVEEVL